MPNLKFKASRKTTVIILVVLFFILGGTGVYLLWRVNQQKTLAPGETNAGGDICCCPRNDQNPNPPQNCEIYPWKGYEECSCTNGWCPTVPHCSQQCVKGSDCNSLTNCQWPAVAYCASGKCECKNPPNNGCNSNYEPCNPECPAGYTPCSGVGCTGDVQNASCTGYCKDCNNKYIQTIKCNKVAENTCDAKNAKWVTKPATTIPYGQLIPFEYITGDTDGVQNENIIVKIDGNSKSVTKVPATGNPVNITVKGELNGSESVLSPGTHKLEISWNDTKGAGGVPCYAYASFTVGAAPVNTCDALGAKWVKQPPTRVEYGKAIPFEYITGDTDGVQNANILVKLDGASVSVTKVPATDNAPNVTVKGELRNVGVGDDHKLEISWNDIKGAGGVPCYAYAIFDVTPQNPDWEIQKVSTEECIDDGTENPISKVSNSITIRNKNTTSGSTGSITTIVDTLDSKVNSSTITNISNGGVVANGIITWNLTPPLSVFNPGQSKSFTYSYTVAKDAFGMYDNRVEAIVGEQSSNTLQAGASIEARCNILNPSCGNGEVETGLGEQCDPPGGACTDIYGKPNTCSDICTCPGTGPVPDTGLFDESENIVTLGAVLLFLGLGWTWLNRTYEIANGKLVQRSKERFEQRVVKN